MGGGSYTVTSSTLSNSAYAGYGKQSLTTFETFCLEYTETFTPGVSYNYTQDAFASNGGYNAPADQKDEISIGTAWLYSRFAAGNLGSAFNTSNSISYIQSNTDLQLAFWWLEEEIGAIPTSRLPGGSFNASSNVFLTLAQTQLGLSLNDLRGDATGDAFGVEVLNLTASNGNAKQSQLYYTGTTVPDGASTLVLLTGALFSLLGLRRRIQK
jgi:hypothetical protein